MRARSWRSWLGTLEEGLRLVLAVQRIASRLRDVAQRGTEATLSGCVSCWSGPLGSGRSVDCIYYVRGLFKSANWADHGASNPVLATNRAALIRSTITGLVVPIPLGHQARLLRHRAKTSPHDSRHLRTLAGSVQRS